MALTRLASESVPLIALLTITLGMLEPTLGQKQAVSDGLRMYARLSAHTMKLSSDPPDVELVSAECMAALNASNSTEQMVEVLDSFGKPASGILAGSLAWLGNFDQCMSISEYRHCLVGISANLSQILGTPVVLPIKWGVCVPEVCSEQDVKNALELLLDYVDMGWLTAGAMYGSTVYCTNKPNTDFSAGFIATCTLLSLLAALALLGSVVDYFYNSRSTADNKRESTNEVKGQQNGGVGSQSAEENVYEELGPGDGAKSEVNTSNSEVKKLTEKTPLLTKQPTQDSATVISLDVQHNAKPSVFVRLLLCFAASRTLPKILSTKQGEGGIPCLNGLRVISISWVILGHTFAFEVLPMASDNLPMAVSRWLDRFIFSAIGNAFCSVDTFFFLSGLLVTYLVLNKMKMAGGRIPWGWFYLHRYIRLTPSIGVLILVLVFMMPNLGQGPVWSLQYFLSESCSKYWWTNLVYVNNFLPRGTQDCIEWGWYLANDMQFFIISPLIILPLFWYPAVGIAILVVLCLTSFITSAILMYQYEYLPSLFLSSIKIFVPTLTNLPGNDSDFMSVIYSKPYVRIPPYLVGMAMGYVIYRIGSRRVKLSPVLTATGWAVASGLGIAVVYGLYDVQRGARIPTAAESMAYTSLYAFAWSIAVAWVVFACHYGYGGIVNSFLSWTLWVPLSRLTYAVYLFHPLVIYVFAFSVTTPVHFSSVTLVYMFASYLLLSHLVALFITLLLEFPIGNLEKMMRGSSSSEDKRGTR